MKNKTCLVTGGTSGIGQAVATQLARQGASVFLTGRDAARGASAVDAIRADGGQAEFFPADFSSLASVRALAEEVGRRCDRLDVLVNNAGLVGSPARRLTADGFEETFAVNHLAAFLLTEKLRGLLLAAGSARVVTVSSDAHRASADSSNSTISRASAATSRCAPTASPSWPTSCSPTNWPGAWRAPAWRRTCLHPGVVRTRIWAGGRGACIGAVHRVGKTVHAFCRTQRALGHAAGGGHPSWKAPPAVTFNREREVPFLARLARSAGGGPALGGKRPADVSETVGQAHRLPS